MYRIHLLIEVVDRNVQKKIFGSFGTYVESNEWNRTLTATNHSELRKEHEK